jgi:hypothetical protein
VADEPGGAAEGEQTDAQASAPSSEQEALRTTIPSESAPLDDGWSSDEEELTDEQKQQFIAMECQALGFAADDTSIAAMLASVKRSKIGNEHAKRGLAYSSDGRAIAQAALRVAI